MGILASSPELMDVVQRRQPVQMANGGDATYMAAIQSLAQQGDVQTLMNISRDDRLSRPIRNAALEAVRGASGKRQTTQISTGPEVDVAGSIKTALIGTDEARSPMQSFNKAVGDAITKTFTTMPPQLEQIGSGIGSIYDYLTGPQPTPQGIENRRTNLERYAEAARADRGIAGFTVGPEMRDATVDLEGGVAPPDMPTLISDGVTPTPTDTTTGDTAGPRLVSTTDPKAKPPKDPNAPTTAAGLLNLDRAGATSDLTRQLESDITRLNTQMLTGITDNRALTIDAGKRLTENLTKLDTAMQEKFQKAKKYTLSDVKDEALKLSGIDTKDYDEKRKDAFWMGLMRAGLAIAAGESDNALTNIAKGLGVGLEGYGKDIGTLNDNEREDRKELRALQLSLIKSKDDRALAETTALNNFNFQKQQLAQQAVQGARQEVLAARAQENSYNLATQQLQATLAYQLNTSKREDMKQAADTAYKQFSARIALMPDELKQTLVVDGYGSVNPDGTFTLTDAGQKYYKSLIDAGLKSKYSVTDLDKSVRGDADREGAMIHGVPLTGELNNRRNQAMIWHSRYQDDWENAGKDMLNGEARRKQILNSFAQDIGGQVTRNDATGGGNQLDVTTLDDARQRDLYLAKPENTPFTVDNKTFIRQGNIVSEYTAPSK